MLTRLGFEFTVQAGVRTATGHRQPDYALFGGAAARTSADQNTGGDRYRDALAVCDAKRFDRPLDSRRREGALSDDPVAQIIQYVAVTRVGWGVLTNGRHWRLYAAEGDLVEGACLDVDLIALLEAGDIDAFRVFAVLFSADALRRNERGRCLLDRALAGSRAQATAVGTALQRQVFAALPLLARGLLGDDEPTEAMLTEAFDNTLVVLYRLLFCLHAEDRGLLPIDNTHYQRYSLRRQRGQIAEDRAADRIYSSRSDDLYNDLRALFRIVDQGDPALGVNAYDGGLFAADRHVWLRGRTITDDRLSEALDLLYRVDGRQVDFRDLSVRHLGTIFEQLLAYRLQAGPEGVLTLVPAGGRKATGAYFTPEHIVDDLVERTLAPLVDERSAAVRAKALTGQAALDELLSLAVLDPAMGSGHFLVGAASYIARRIATDPGFDLPLSLPELQGLVAERCLYGVDVNPMAVEIAQLALWLTTVRDDRPLRYFTNLRVGNSLVGAELGPLLDGGTDLFADDLARRAATMLDGLRSIAAIDARDTDLVHEQQALGAELDAVRVPLTTMLDQAVAPAVAPSAGPPLHWEVAFPERFLTARGERLPDAGFDAVVGNPPYLRIQELGRDLAAYCREHYATAFGSYDAYVVFVEQGMRLLRRDGRLGYIVPSTFLKLDYGRRLRALLARTGRVEQLVDFGHAQVFDAATNYTCLLVLRQSGVPELEYTAVRGDAAAVRTAIASGRLPAAERYRNGALGEDPWLLVPPEERAVIEAMQAAGDRLDAKVGPIFTGLQTSADDVYILGDREAHGGFRAVRTQSGDELLLEPDLLRPLARGVDVDPYTLPPLGQLLLFPYVRDGDRMRLVSLQELERLPRTLAYLRAHEDRLRGRERGKMDRDEGWWAFGRNQSLGLHDRPKLGVAATVQHLEVAADADGSAAFHNVRVNGVLPRSGGPSLMTLCAVLNTRIVDFAFRRQAAPLANGYFTANKQFIAWLPIPNELPAELDTLGAALHANAAAAAGERVGYLRWLSSVVGADLEDLRGSRSLRRFDEGSAEAVLAVLDANRSRLGTDPASRAVRDLIRTETTRSIGQLAGLRRAMVAPRNQVEALVRDAYRLGVATRTTVDRDAQVATVSDPNASNIATSTA